MLIKYKQYIKGIIILFILLIIIIYYGLMLMLLVSLSLYKYFFISNNNMTTILIIEKKGHNFLLTTYDDFVSSHQSGFAFCTALRVNESSMPCKINKDVNLHHDSYRPTLSSSSRVCSKAVLTNLFLFQPLSAR